MQGKIVRVAAISGCTLILAALAGILAASLYAGFVRLVTLVALLAVSL